MIGISVVLIILVLFDLDYQDLISRQNRGSFLGIISMILNIIAMLLSNRHDVKSNIQ